MSEELELKTIEDEIREQRKLLKERLKELEIQLEQCEKGNCVMSGVSPRKCIHSSKVGCSCLSDKRGLLYCERLKREFSFIRDFLALL